MLRVDRIARFIIIIVSVIIIVLGIGYFLLSNKNSFIRNISHIDDTITNLTHIPNEDFYRMASSKNYKKKGIAFFEVNGYKNIDLEDKVENTNIKIEGKYDGENKQSYTEYLWNKDDKELLKVKAIRDGDKFGIKSDEVVNAYATVENKNISELLNKLNKKFIYDIEKVEINTLIDIFKLDNLEKDMLNEYNKIIKKNTSEKNYTKVKEKVYIEGKEKNIAGYKLELSKEETSKILIEICEKLKNDSITLNMISKKMKTLGFSEEQSNINFINSRIENIEEQIRNKKMDVKELNITVYKKCEIVKINYGKINIVINSYNKGETSFLFKNDNNEIEIKTKKNGTSNYKTEILTKDSIREIKIKIEENQQDKVLSNKVDIEFTDKNGTSNIYAELENEITDERFQLERLTNQNSVIINDYTKEGLKMLMNAIQRQYNMIYEVKKMSL